MQLSLERTEKVRVFIDTDIEPNASVHRSGEELARVLASFGGKMPTLNPVGRLSTPPPER